MARKEARQECDRGRSLVPWLMVVLSTMIVSSASAVPDAYVDAGATGNDDGTSWTDAYADLQDALSNASAGDVIWVAAGTYYPDSGGDQTVTFRISNPAVKLYGGYCGSGGTTGCGSASDRPFYCYQGDGSWGSSCTSRSDCYSGGVDVGYLCLPRNTSILSGDIDTDSTLDADNSIHVVSYERYDASNTPVLDGFVVEGGYADGSGATAQNQGSGVQIRGFVCVSGTNDGDPCVVSGDCPGGTCTLQKCVEGGPTLNNCIFRDNYAADHGAVNDHAHTTTIDNCFFEDNYGGSNGGALRIESGNTTVTDCVFDDNEAADDGGAVWTGHSSDDTCDIGGDNDPDNDSLPDFTDCRFTNNTAGDRGGAYFLEAGSPDFTDCYFDSNSVTNTGAEGGAVWLGHCDATCDAGSEETPSNVTMDGCWFEDNSSKEFGGAIVARGGSTSGDWVDLDMSDCTFNGNSTVNGSTDGGGAMWFGGVIVKADDTRFYNNHGSVGGATWNGNSDFTCTRCIFIGNSVYEYAFGGAHYEDQETTSANDFVTRFINSRFVRNGGTVCDFHQATDFVHNCLFTGNALVTSMSFGSSTGHVSNCTVVSNTVTPWADDSSATQLTADTISSAVTVTNSIFWDNASGAEITNASSITVNYSDVEDTWSGSGGNNVDTDPGFSTGFSGTWTAEYGAGTDHPVFGDTFTDSNASWTKDELVGYVLNPDTSGGTEYYIVANTATTIAVSGSPGSGFNTKSYTVTTMSPTTGVIDIGDNGGTCGSSCAECCDATITSCSDLGTPDFTVWRDCWDLDNDSDTDEMTPDLLSDARLQDGGSDCVIDLGALEKSGTVCCVADSDCSSNQVCCTDTNTCVAEPGSGACCQDSDCTGAYEGYVCCGNVCRSWGCCDDSYCSQPEPCCIHHFCSTCPE